MTLLVAWQVSTKLVKKGYALGTEAPAWISKQLHFTHTHWKNANIGRKGGIERSKEKVNHTASFHKRTIEASGKIPPSRAKEKLCW